MITSFIKNINQQKLILNLKNTQFFLNFDQNFVSTSLWISLNILFIFKFEL